MEELGGLAKRMPLTWLAFVVGAAAIVGVPPFNGFVSEWLVYQGLFSTGESAKLLRIALLGIPALALIGALALACFAKVAGIVFLGVPRSTHAREATERGRGAIAPLLALAAACVVLGVVPTLGISLVKSSAQQLSGLEGAAFPDSVLAGARTISMLAALLFVASGVLLWIRRALLRRQTVRREPTWACAYDVPTPRMQYTASSFAAPLLDVFGRLSGTRVERGISTIHTQPVDLVLDGVALPLWGAFHRAAMRMRAIQHGRLHFYLLYVLAALVLLLGYLSLWPRL